VPLTSGEIRRKLLHMGVGGFAFLLRWLTWPQAAAMALAAFLFNWQVLPRIGGRALWRDGERERGYTLGMLFYPLAVLGLILAFRLELWKAAAVWGMLAFGDGMAALVGQAVGGPRLPWNARKGWVGFGAFVVCGTLGAAVLAGWTLRLPPATWTSAWIVGYVGVAVLFAALVESAPSTLDDNLTVPLVGGIVMALVTWAEPGRLLQNAALPAWLLQGLLVNGAIALMAWRARSIDVPGALSAVVIGTLITLGTTLRGFALMVAFFVIGSIVTRWGYGLKLARGIAQERGGARGWRNAWANGGVPAFLALMAGMTPPDVRALFVIAYAAAVATAAADTCSSEVGKAYGRRTFLITTFRPVPAGTEGAVSLEGTLGGFVGAALVASLGALLGLYTWPAAGLVAVAGLLGSLAESVIGTVAERRGWLDNDLLNALNTAIGGALAALLARATGLGA
jgi:uncharacterized protein (TIGR00297 family)